MALSLGKGSFRLVSISLAFSLVGLLAYAGDYFGSSGQSGSDGATGSQGRSGQGAVLTATGQTAILDLSGANGLDGYDGRKGEDASSCSQPTGASSVIGADGGDGGRGGDGGDGGNGGDILVYADDISKLSLIAVRSIPGEGGRPGRGGYGGDGCACSTTSWESETCVDDVCETDTYYCTHGSDGRDGRDGSVGSRGRYGRLDLVRRIQPLEPVEPSRAVKIPDLFNGMITLSDNIWILRTGARALLAPGSQISDEYREFSHRQEYRSAYVWEARKPVSEFASIEAWISVSQKNERALLKLPYDVWSQTREEIQGDVFVTTVEKMLFAQDAAKLSVSWEGSGSNLVLRVEDLAKVSDLVASDFTVRFMRQKSLWKDKKLFEGQVPAHLVVQEGHVFKLQLGKLPGIDKDDIKGGKTVDADLTVLRSLNDKQASKSFRKVEYKIPKK